MAKINIQSMIEDLQKAKDDYIAAIAAIEDINVDDRVKHKATVIIQEGQIQG